VLRTAGGTGIKLSKAATESNEVRRDGMRQRGRHGTQKIALAYNAEMSLGSHDSIIEAIARDTWSSANLTLTQSDFTSLTTGTNTIILASGDPRSLGIRVGDVIDLTSYSVTADDLTNLRVTGLSATTITVAETITANTSADTTCNIIRRGKKLTPYASGGLVKKYFTIEEYEADIDQSTVCQDCVFGGVKFTMQPNGLLLGDITGAGTGQILAEATGSSPYFTSPSATTAAPFSVVDATIRLNGVDLVALTSLDLTVDIGPAGPDTFGSGAIKYAPDVFTGQMAVSMNLTMLRKDLTSCPTSSPRRSIRCTSWRWRTSPSRRISSRSTCRTSPSAAPTRRRCPSRAAAAPRPSASRRRWSASTTPAPATTPP
jgi:hypothetical protein